MKRSRLLFLLSLPFAILLMASCSITPEPALLPSATVGLSKTLPAPSAAPSITTTPEPSETPTRTPTTTSTPTPTPTTSQEPQGCRRPGDDYTVAKVNGWLVNQRTLEMLQYASELYGGEIEITGYAVTQGSFTDQVAASFGTHAGGGAVDLSVMRAGTYTVLYDEIEPLVNALRLAGFAAWLRDLDELYPGSSIHIHAVAVGDEQLSQAARDQLTGLYGYFRGYSGVPQPNQTPVPDRHAGPLICLWMLEMGYSDLRQ